MHDHLTSPRAASFTAQVRVSRAASRCLGALFSLALFVGCTKDPVEHQQAPVAPPSPPSSTEADASPSGETDGSSQAATTTTTPARDASAPGSHDAGSTSAPAPDGGGAPTATEPDAGSELLPAERVAQAVAEQCGSRPASEASFTRKALRGAAADCAMWHYCSFETVANELSMSVAAHESNPSEESLELSRQLWRLAMTSWSHVELFQFGPLGSRSMAAGKDDHAGEGIREVLYSWPSISACSVDEQLISQNYATRGMQDIRISGRGLFALEYLLFSSSSSSACSAASATAQQWGELSGAEFTRRRHAYATAVAADVLERTRALNELWSPTGGDFKATLTDASSPYPNEQEALKAIAWSLVYAERELKDWKLGVPAGYTAIHPVGDAETPYARQGTENIRANLRGFRSLFQGCGADGEGLGFDDWLVEANHAELASDMIAAWEGAQRAADAFPALEDASASELEALYRAVKGLTDLLKNEFFGAGSPLNLQLPGGVEGDTD